MMEIVNPSVVKKEYILLDWNVIKYLKTPRNSLHEDCKLLLDSICKRYEFPFCEAHLRDLAKSFSKDNIKFIEEDLEFLQKISHNIAIAINREEFILVKSDPHQLFNEIISEDEVKPNITSEMNPQTVFQINMQELDPQNPLFGMFEKTGGVYKPDAMAEWMNNSFDSLFYEVDLYKSLREYVEKLRTELKNDSQNPVLSQADINYKTHIIQCVSPFLESVDIKDEEILCSIWKDVIIKFLRINPEKIISFGELIKNAYNILDMHPLFKDKLKKGKNTLDNITRDSNMIYFASQGKYFVTEDKKCLKKADFIFKAFKCKTKVINMEQLVQIFS